MNLSYFMKKERAEAGEVKLPVFIPEIASGSLLLEVMHS